MVGGGESQRGERRTCTTNRNGHVSEIVKKIQYTDLTKKKIEYFRRRRWVSNMTPESTIPKNRKQRSGPCGQLSICERKSLRHRRQPDTYLVPSRATRRRAPYSCCWTCCCCTSWAPLRYSGRRRKRNGAIRVKYAKSTQQPTLGITRHWQDTEHTSEHTLYTEDDGWSLSEAQHGRHAPQWRQQRARRRIPRCSNPLPPPKRNNVHDSCAMCTATAAPSSHLRRRRRLYNNNNRRRRRRQVPHVRVEYATTSTNTSTWYTRPSTTDIRRWYLDNKI